MANEDSPQEQPKLPEAKISFFVKNDPASQAMARRKVKPRGNKEGEAAVVSWNWYDTMQDAHKRAFVVAKMTKADLLTDVHDSLQKALDEGWSFEHWKKEIVPKLEGKWLGRSVGELWDELSEEEKAKREEPTEEQRKKIISPKRLETIFYTNMRVSNAAGHYEQLMRTKDLYPYWKYVTEHDSKVRDAHRVLHNKVFKWDDPFWETYFPPNGFRCRCHVVPMDKYDLEDEGLRVQTGNIATDADGRKVLDIDGRIYRNDIGWDYNPGKSTDALVNLAKSNEKGRPAAVQADLEADLAKKEAEEQRQAAEAAARAEAERLAQEAAKARAEAERKAQEIEQRLQEAQARAAQRQAQRRAKQAQEAERREKEAEKRRQAAEAAAQKEALQEAQRREAERLRDAEVQKVLRQAREAQDVFKVQQPRRSEEAAKLKAYLSEGKVRLRKDTTVPAKEERKFVKLAKNIEYQIPDHERGRIDLWRQNPNEDAQAVVIPGTNGQLLRPIRNTFNNNVRSNDRDILNPDADNNGHLSTDRRSLNQRPARQMLDPNSEEYKTRLAAALDKYSDKNCDERTKQECLLILRRLVAYGDMPIDYETSEPHKNDRGEYMIIFRGGKYSIESAQKTLQYYVYEHAILFDRKNRCHIEVCSGSQSKVSLPSNEDYSGFTILHNHPDGTFFSRADMSMAFALNARELQIVSGLGHIYSLIPTGIDDRKHLYLDSASPSFLECYSEYATYRVDYKNFKYLPSWRQHEILLPYLKISRYARLIV